MASVSFKFDNDSLRRVSGGSKQVMVYGFERCLYKEMEQYINTGKAGSVAKSFDWTLGYFRGDADVSKTLDGRNIERLEFTVSASDRQSIARQCKTAITNLVLENYKRAKQGLPIIPLIFCLDIDGNTRPFETEHVAVKDPKRNGTITHKELRRMYKLAHQFENAELRKVAQDTFKFVKLTAVGENSYRLDPIEAPWNDTRWDGYWATRMAQKSTTPDSSEKRHWREDLSSRIAYHNKNVLSKLVIQTQKLADKVSDRMLTFVADRMYWPIYG